MRAYFFGTDLVNRDHGNGVVHSEPQYVMQVLAPTHKAAKKYMTERFGFCHFNQYDLDCFIPNMHSLHKIGHRAKFLEFVEVDKDGLLVDRYCLPTEICPEVHA